MGGGFSGLSEFGGVENMMHIPTSTNLILLYSRTSE